MQRSKAAFLYLKSKLLRTDSERDPPDTLGADLLVTTRVQPFRMRWVVERFPLFDGLKSPDFQPTPWERLQLQVERQERALQLLLLDRSGEGVEASFDVAISDTRGACLKRRRGIVRLARGIGSAPESLLRLSRPPAAGALVVDLVLKTRGGVSTYCRRSDPSAQRQANLLRDLAALFERPQYTDVVFRVGEAAIPGHRALLGCRSPSFAAMFASGMAESGEPCPEVPVPDVRPNAFRQLLEFLYTGGVVFPERPACAGELYDLYYAADKYQVTDLRRLCCDMACSLLTDGDAPDVLSWAEAHGDSELKLCALHFVVSHYEDIAVTEKWKEFTVKQPQLTAEVQKRLSL